MEKLRLSWLSREKYQDYPLKFHYTTDRYYHVCADEMGFRLELRSFPTPVKKSFEDELFSSWLEDPVALGAFDGENLVGVVEGSIEGWHQVFRISNLLVRESYRNGGTGSALIRHMIDHARSIPDCRGVILETQSCNYPAISFYRKHGFLLNRIDLREYSNQDIQQCEVRLDFFLPFDTAEK